MSIGIIVNAALAAQPVHIRVGERFVEQNAPGRILQVAHLLHPGNGIPHARLRAVSNSRQNILVSCVALDDPGSYRRLGLADEE